MEIATALRADPVLLLLDEPVAGLRLKEKQALASALKQLRDEGLAILPVEHDMDLVTALVYCTLAMKSCIRLIEGTPEEAQAGSAVRARFTSASSSDRLAGPDRQAARPDI